ncbi:MAG: hypothetical protein R2785_03440 [Flavobacteriaceae bacterium]
MKAHLFTIVVIGLLFSCTDASEEDLIESTPLEDVVTYVDDVKSIMDNNCIFCHSNPPENGAPMPLLTYEQVKEAVENRDLINRISTEDLAFVMPFGGPRLPQNLIDVVIKWQTDGLLEE